jgi:hemolysin III
MTPDQPLPQRVSDNAHDAAVQVRAKVRYVKDEVKPHLRGWLHAATTPLALVAGIVLVVLSPTQTTRVGSAVFASTALLLFTVSAIYHRGNWSERSWAFLRRFDHSNIYLLIAGSYTPFTLILLEGSARVALLVIVWSGAALGVAFRIFWTDAPRWMYTPIYFALGAVAIFYANDFSSAGVAVITLIAVGGGLYSLGGLVYGLRKPNPFPTWFGFHEVFHTFTIAAFACHYAAASIATYQLR